MLEFSGMTLLCLVLRNNQMAGQGGKEPFTPPTFSNYLWKQSLII